MSNSPTTKKSPESSPRLLLVEDDEAIRDRLSEAFALDGYSVTDAPDLAAARSRLNRETFDLALLDISLPDGTGYELLRSLRAGEISPDRPAAAETPVVIVSGRCDEIDRVRGFELGCDDYVAKPYSLAELRGRIAAVLRRRRSVCSRPVQDLGELEIDVPARLVHLRGRRIDLTAKEFSLLCALASEPTRVFERDQLFEAVWGYRGAGSTRTLDAHACRLRAKLSGGQRRYILNTWGVGYRLFEPAPGGES
jgi:DNA-binding response OmpR family regulator